MSGDADYRKRRYNDLTPAGKKSYDSDPAYKRKRIAQWNQEYAAIGAGTAKEPAHLGVTPVQAAAKSPTGSPFATDSASATIPPDYTSTATLLGISGDAGLAEVGDYQNPGGYYQSGSDPQGAGDINAGPRGSHLQIYQVLQGYYKLSPTELADLQKKLYDAGYYPDSYYGGNKKPTFGNGDPDDPGYAAYKSAVEDAALHKATVSGTIGARAGTGKNKVGAGAVKQGEIVQLTPEVDIKTMVDKAMPDEIGRRLTPAELAGVVAAYHAAEKAYYDRQYAASGSGLPGGPGGTFDKPPDLSSIAQQEAEKNHPAEYQAQQELGYVDQAIALIRSRQ